MKRQNVLVLVAGLIVLSCAGLLLPAIARTREAASRMNCHGHFCWLSLALHNYAAGNDQAFPSATIPQSGFPPGQRLSWNVSLLPYIEQESVFKQFDLMHRPGDPANAQATSHRFRHLVCPSSGEYTYERNDVRWKSPTPLAHYVGVSGCGADAAALPFFHTRAGVFGYNRRTKLKEDIHDGTSNTLLLIETSHDPGHWAYGGPPTVRGFEQDTLQYVGPGRAFGGFHAGMPVLYGVRTPNCTASMADASVRSFTNATAPEVLEALATVAGKETLPADW